MQRPQAPRAVQFLVERVRGRQCAGVDHDDRVEGRPFPVIGFDVVDIGLHQLPTGQLFSDQRRADIRDRRLLDRHHPKHFSPADCRVRHGDQRDHYGRDRTSQPRCHIGLLHRSGSPGARLSLCIFFGKAQPGAAGRCLTRAAARHESKRRKGSIFRPNPIISAATRTTG